MMRLVLLPLGLSLILTATGAAQVKINIPDQHYERQERIHATVQNASSRPITVCVGFLGSLESTPSPFWVERYSDGKWHALIMGPDIGHEKGAWVLEAGESREFFVRLSDSGKLRLKLDYWRGSIPNLDCDAPLKGMKVARSAVFGID
jgi:hypothetical protein